MKFLVIGLGSMGKRRIRCLQSLGITNITGYDPRDDRRTEAGALYRIKTLERFPADVSEFDLLIISVPPDRHLEYLQMAVDQGKPAFVEASVIIDGLEELDQKARRRNILIAPSCTLRFHPAVQIITRLVKEGQYGAFTNFSYHSGQYLPDWHPWEAVSDYYVAKRETGGAREIVPFELTWLVDVLGGPVALTGLRGKTMDVGADIDDTYAMAIQFQQGFGTLLVDVVARNAVRNLILNLERGQIFWRWDEPQVRVYDAITQQWTSISYQAAGAHEGYNRNIIEDMYINELGAFINAVKGAGTYPHTLAGDIEVLKLLSLAERMTSGRIVRES